MILELLALGRDEYRMSSLRRQPSPLELYRVAGDDLQIEDESSISQRID